MDIILSLVIVAIAGSFAWRIVQIVIAVNTVRKVQAQFDQQLQQALQMSRQLRSQTPAQPPAPNPQLWAALLDLQRQMQQMDDLGRQRNAAKVGEMMNAAASVGIRWSPPA